MFRMLDKIWRFYLLACEGLAHHIDIAAAGPEPAMTAVNFRKFWTRRTAAPLDDRQGAFEKLMPVKASLAATHQLAASSLFREYR